MTPSWSWLADFASARGLTYEPEADERWLRAFEPFVTLRTPIGYAHALHATGPRGSLSVARLNLDERDAGAPSAWIAVAQDDRLPAARAAAASDPAPTSPFAEDVDLVPMPKRLTRDLLFDQTFAAYAPSDEDVATAITPSLRKLTLSWRIPLHFEVRPGAFVLVPVALPADPASLGWLLDAVRFFGDKAAKRVK